MTNNIKENGIYLIEDFYVNVLLPLVMATLTNIVGFIIYPYSKFDLLNFQITILIFFAYSIFFSVIKNERM